MVTQPVDNSRLISTDIRTKQCVARAGAEGRRRADSEGLRVSQQLEEWCVVTEDDGNRRLKSGVSAKEIRCFKLLYMEDPAEARRGDREAQFDSECAIHAPEERNRIWVSSRMVVSMRTDVAAVGVAGHDRFEISPAEHTRESVSFGEIKVLHVQLPLSRLHRKCVLLHFDDALRFTFLSFVSSRLRMLKSAEMPKKARVILYDRVLQYLRKCRFRVQNVLGIFEEIRSLWLMRDVDTRSRFSCGMDICLIACEIATECLVSLPTEARCRRCYRRRDILVKDLIPIFFYVWLILIQGRWGEWCEGVKPGGGWLHVRMPSNIAITSVMVFLPLPEFVFTLWVQ